MGFVGWIHKDLYIDFLSDRESTINISIKNNLIRQLVKSNNEDIKFESLLSINEIIEQEYHKKNNTSLKQHKSYDVNYIKNVINYQAENNFSNNYISNTFKLSRNTVSKWKSIFSKDS